MVTLSACALVCLLAGTDSNTVLLEFTADWCGACRTVEPTVQRLMAEGYPVQRVVVDQQREAAARFRISAVPCFVLVSGGRELERVEGAVSYERLVQMLTRAGNPAIQNHSPSVSASGSSSERTVRGQSPTGAGGGMSLPRPFASIAQGLTNRNRDPRAAEPQVSVPMEARGGTSLSPSTHHGRATAMPAATPQNNQVADQRVVQLALAATVRIRVHDGTGHSLGTGTIIDSHGSEVLVVTCGHIFRDSSGKGRIDVDVFTGGQPRTVNGTLLSYDLERDVALLAFAPGQPVTPVRVAPPAFQVSVGKPVFSIGCDQGAAPSVRPSSITSIDRYHGAPNLQVAGMPIDGRSGGGLFSGEGFLIGICNAADPQDQEGIFASLPVIHWELDKIGQRAVYDSHGTTLAANPPDRSGAAAPISQGNPVSPQPTAPGSIPRDMPSANVALGAPPSAVAAASEDTEVICIVRSRNNPQGSERLLVLDRPSRELLRQLAQESQRAPTVAANSAVGSGATPPSPVIRAQSNQR